MKQLKRKTITQLFLLLLVAMVGLHGCAVAQQNVAPSISPEETKIRIIEVEIMDFSNETENVIY